MKYQLGFIGCGNMGGSLVKAVAKSVDGKQIGVCDYCVEKAVALANACKVQVANANEIARESKFVVLGVKPQNMQETLAPLQALLAENKEVVLITMAAGLSISAIQQYAGGNYPVIRIMPNTPACLGAGMILYATQSVTDTDEQAFLTYFAKAGVLDKLPESQIDAGSALSGCGPAYVYAFAEALADGAVECGLPRDKANLYTAQTLLGASKMLLEFGHPADLKDAVCSPGGTTIAGLHALEKGGFSSATMDAILSAYKRTLELKK